METSPTASSGVHGIQQFIKGDFQLAAAYTNRAGPVHQLLERWSWLKVAGWVMDGCWLMVG